MNELINVENKIGVSFKVNESFKKYAKKEIKIYKIGKTKSLLIPFFKVIRSQKKPKIAIKIAAFFMSKLFNRYITIGA